MPPPLISFYGDDFTGSTDAMESLALAGVRTVLFTEPPTPARLAQDPGIGAFGVAGLTRSLPPEEMERQIRPAFEALRASGAPIIHYKTCSTFDSSPRIGSIGRVIDVGMELFGSTCVPLLVAAPAIGRYCLFGNLFARCGAESDPVRLDRHPSMSRHPITPMDEADLRLHLAKQTTKHIGLLDILHVAAGDDDVECRFEELRRAGSQIVLIDLLHGNQLSTIGRLISRQMTRDQPLFIVGSSGVEAALAAHWRQTAVISAPADFASVGDAGPILVASGSCSPVTAGQIEWAIAHGFADVAIDTPRLIDERSAERVMRDGVDSAINALQQGQSVILHTGRGPSDERVDATRRALKDFHGKNGSSTNASQIIGAALGGLVRRVMESKPIRRLAIAGGDTSSQLARALGIESVEMIGRLTPGSPLCRASAPGSGADGVEITFKGGQIGKSDFFTSVRSGPLHPLPEHRDANAELIERNA